MTTLTKNRILHRFSTVVVALALVSVVVPLTGCKAGRTGPTTRRPPGPEAASTEGVDIDMDAPESDEMEPSTAVGRMGAEADLAEDVAHFRAMYRRSVTALRDFYEQTGYTTKRNWAQYELDRLEAIKPHRYVMEAEVPKKELKAEESNAGADALYERGLQLMREGGHGRASIFYKEGKFTQAAETFRELIETYPTSDKIDDAAFELGEIHRMYFKDQKGLAAKWYERAFTWDPATPHPARYRAAYLYDYRLRNKQRALELYHLVVAEETHYPRFVRAAERRIDDLGHTVAFAPSK